MDNKPILYIMALTELENCLVMLSTNSFSCLYLFGFSNWYHVQKALDSLVESGNIVFKEYGKRKIYIARQD